MDTLIIALAFIAIIQPVHNRRNTCVMFALYHAAFYVLCGALPGEVYFISAAATAGVCAVVLSKAEEVKALIGLCKLSVAINLAGWVAYESSATADPYVLCFTAYYVAAILIIAFGGVQDGIHKTRGDISRVLLYHHKDSGGHA